MANDDSNDEEDPGLAVVRQVADKSTVASVKQTLLTALLVRAVQAPRSPPRRIKRFAAATAVTIVLVSVLGHGNVADVLANLL